MTALIACSDGAVRWILAALLVLAPACSGGRDENAPTSASAPKPVSIAAPVTPDARTEVAGAAWQNLVIVAGGMTQDGSASSRVDAFDTATGTWSQAPPLPVPVHHAGAAVAAGRLWIVGGYTNGAGQAPVAIANAVSIGPGEAAWRIESPLPQARAALALVSARDVLVAIGGVVDGKPSGSTVMLRIGQGWEDGPPLANAREHHAAAAAGPRIYAIAGRTGGLESNIGSVESLDIRTPGRGWRGEPGLNDSRGGTAAAAAPDGKQICVAGGEQASGTIASVECFSDGRWDRAATMNTPRHGLAAVWHGDGLHLVAGGNQPGLNTSNVHELFTQGLPRR
ncbi:MAG TPA: kelch repeat-containing protein [Acidimicrobiales bacterium]|nr:kelch repeat-containing protein [Acidimicrobiales bacterium]